MWETAVPITGKCRIKRTMGRDFLPKKLLKSQSPRNIYSSHWHNFTCNLVTSQPIEPIQTAIAKSPPTLWANVWDSRGTWTASLGNAACGTLAPVGSEDSCTGSGTHMQ